MRRLLRSTLHELALHARRPQLCSLFRDHTARNRSEDRSGAARRRNGARRVGAGATTKGRVVGPNAILIRLTAGALGLVVGGLVGEISARVYASFDQHAHRVLLQAAPLAVLIAAQGELGYRPRPN